MKIVVSACLLGVNCKYSGGNNRNEKIIAFCEGHEVIPVCPESEGGLPIPREPAEIVNGRATNRVGVDVDAEFHRGADRVLERIGKDVDLAILQARSPSCGVHQIYDGTFTGTLIEGHGIFAEKLIELGIPTRDSSEF